MTQRLYLDGCSLTYGLNLPRESTLEHLFVENGDYNVTNNSRPGKSNLAIALDAFKNYRNHEVIVIGWTYSSRFYLKYHGMDIDLLATREYVELPNTLDSALIEETYQELHRQFYSLYDSTYHNELSDMLITSIYYTAQAENKKIIFFGWEHRQTPINIYYPHIPSKFRLPCGHLNADGTMRLYNTLQGLLSE